MHIEKKLNCMRWITVFFMWNWDIPSYILTFLVILPERGESLPLKQQELHDFSANVVILFQPDSPTKKNLVFQ
jgi:hypothetical protein